MVASIEVKAAHERALRWSHVLSWQVDRLYESRATAEASQRERFGKRPYELVDSWPFYEMQAEGHFVMVAARQLLRALRLFDGDDRLPSDLDDLHLRTLRDALEHSDEPYGRAARRMQQLGADPNSHRWSGEGEGTLGDLVSDSVLRAWGHAVYDELSQWNPG